MIELTKEQEDDMLEERRDEWAKECEVGIYDEWLSDNWIELLKEFADANDQEFKMFCKESYREYEENK